ncbi:MAG: hypothetical protein HXY25_05085 [Alphaproteobacteria bacterium]|nr:hypothetical protein [Alphaproteobacteria bacterium]
MSEKSKSSEPGKPRPDPNSARARAAKADWLGEKLRELYGSYAEEPLPDDLRSLLDRLGAGEDDPPGEAPATNSHGKKGKA